MRKDMKEVLVTEGRHGSRHATNHEVGKARRKRIEEDDVGGRQSMVPRDGPGWHERKIDNKGEHLTPLWRYLRSKVGSKWDDVYSEIKANNPSNSSVGVHIYSHLWHHVEKNVELIDGVPHSYTYHGPTALSNGDLYIDPTDGILRECKNGQLRWSRQRRKAEQKKITTVKKISQTVYAVQNKKGLWFLFEYSNRMKTISVADVKWVLKDFDGVKRNATEIVGYHDELVPYYSTVYADYDDYEAMPGLHPKSYRDPYWRYEDKKNKQHYYLISLKSMSSKEKRLYGVS